MTSWKPIIAGSAAMMLAACSSHGQNLGHNHGDAQGDAHGHAHSSQAPPQAVRSSPSAGSPQGLAVGQAYVASLTGAGALVATPSIATAHARVLLDPVDQTIDLELSVRGITIDQLWDRIIRAPVGPIHFHLYASPDYDSNAVSLAVPVPFGENYRATADGFTVTLRDFSYAQAQDITGSTLDFNGFAERIQRGLVVMNIHTDAYPDGEIGGVVVLPD
jgi:hypothetical protein